MDAARDDPNLARAGLARGSGIGRIVHPLPVRDRAVDGIRDRLCTDLDAGCCCDSGGTAGGRTRDGRTLGGWFPRPRRCLYWGHLPRESEARNAAATRRGSRRGEAGVNNPVEIKAAPRVEQPPLAFQQDFWALRGLDLNQQPLGFETGGLVPPSPAWFVCKWFAPRQATAAPPRGPNL